MLQERERQSGELLDRRRHRPDVGPGGARRRSGAAAAAAPLPARPASGDGRAHRPGRAAEDHARQHRRWGDHDRYRRPGDVHQSGRREDDRLDHWPRPRASRWRRCSGSSTRNAGAGRQPGRAGAERRRGRRPGQPHAADRRDGVEHPIDDSAAPIRDRDGRIDGCVLVFRDISRAAAGRVGTARCRARRVARCARSQMGTPALLHAEDGELLLVNQAIVEHTGYSRCRRADGRRVDPSRRTASGSRS